MASSSSELFFWADTSTRNPSYGFRQILKPHTNMNHTNTNSHLVLVSAIAMALSTSPASAADVPSNLGGGLKPLTEKYQSMATQRKRTLNATQVDSLKRQFPHMKM